MKLKCVILLCIVGFAYAGREKDLTTYCPTVGQALMKAIKDKFLRSKLQAQVKQKQGKPIYHTDSLADAQQLLHPHHYKLSHDTV